MDKLVSAGAGGGVNIERIGQFENRTDDPPSGPASFGCLFFHRF
jgi:hypothetical protein